MGLNLHQMLCIHRWGIYRVPTLKYVIAISQTPVHRSMTLQIFYLQGRGVKQSETRLISQKRYYCAIHVHIIVCLNHLISLCFDNSEAMKNAMIKKIKVACLSVVH